MEWLSSSSSSASSLNGTPPSLPSSTLATNPTNAFKSLNIKRGLRHHINDVMKAGTPLSRYNSMEKLLDILQNRSGAMDRFCKLVRLDAEVRKKCLKTALLDSESGNGEDVYTQDFVLSESSASARFIQTLIQAVDESVLQIPFSDFINSGGRGILNFAIAARVHFLFQRLSSRSVELWRDVLAYSSSVTRIGLPLGYENMKTVKQLHTLLRAAPPEALRMATHDISSALDAIASAFCPSIVKYPHLPSPGALLTRNIFTLLDLIRTLGEKDIWPEFSSPMRWIVKSGIGTALMRIAANDPEHRSGTHEVGYSSSMRCLALASLQGMLEFDVVKLEIVAGECANEWFDTLFAIMLARVQWNIPEDELESLIGSKKIYPHEDAYDVLSCFPRSKFATHLTTVMEDACRAGKEECFKLLEPLAWLTRMEDEELNDAMLSAGVFAFFERMARSPLPENVDGLDYPFECEKKGDALICFRNMLNVMSPAQIARYTTVEMMKLILKLRDDRELPSRVTMRASDAYKAFIGDSMDKRTDRMADEGYRNLRGRVQCVMMAVVSPGSQVEAPQLTPVPAGPGFLADEPCLLGF
ncbi:hypothetical protein FRB99_008953 [Tulasnella sp. 403]|nr:hypothetical protein FRB99_008953 [Tulasnella sp. 403]